MIRPHLILRLIVYIAHLLTILVDAGKRELTFQLNQLRKIDFRNVSGSERGNRLNSLISHTSERFRSQLLESNYGCWCYLYHGQWVRGGGPAQDALDQACKNMHQSFECVIKDTHAKGVDCEPQTVDYVPFDLQKHFLGFSQIEGTTGDLLHDCNFSNANECEISACVIEGTFLVIYFAELFNGRDMIQEEFVHVGRGGNFQPTKKCIPFKDSTPIEDKICCGELPHRTSLVPVIRNYANLVQPDQTIRPFADQSLCIRRKQKKKKWSKGNSLILRSCKKTKSWNDNSRWVFEPVTGLIRSAGRTTGQWCWNVPRLKHDWKQKVKLAKCKPNAKSQVFNYDEEHGRIWLRHIPGLCVGFYEDEKDEERVGILKTPSVSVISMPCFHNTWKPKEIDVCG